MAYSRAQNTSGRIDFGCGTGTWGNDEITTNISSTGMFVTTGYASSPTGGLYNRVQGYQNGVLSWTYAVKNECNQNAGIVASPVVYGNVVAFTYKSCLNGASPVKYSLRQLNATTGAVLSTLYLGEVPQLMPIIWYTSGLMLPVGNELKYVNSSGAFDTSKTFNVDTVNILSYSTSGGVVYRTPDVNDPTLCNVVFRTVAGTETSRQILCDDIPTQNYGMLPNGDLVGAFSTSNTIRVMHKTGATTYTDIPLSSPYGASYVAVFQVIVDNSSNIVVHSAYFDENSVRHATVEVVTSIGLHLGQWSSEVLGSENTFETGTTAMAIANGAIYLDDRVGQRLVKINAPQVSMSYRDSTRWSITSTPAANQLRYVALGDSFSSGEGVPTFEADTDINNVNECHRSDRAYAQLLDQDLSLNLSLVDFKACSGAIAKNMQINQSGQWNEPTQFNALSSTTEVVTLTVGGNDVDFTNYMFICQHMCGPGSPAYDSTISKIADPAFKTRLVETYTGILSKATAAKVYVADYAYMSADDAGDCWITDLSGMRDLEVALNAVIQTAISDMKDASVSGADRLHYVPTNYTGSPFTGKHLCNGSGPSYFNDKKIFNLEYSYHPNTAGAAAYATVFKDYILSH